MMPPASLCVVLHDVTPTTWASCRKVLDAIHAVAPVPLTLLAVPHYHRAPRDAAFEAALDTQLAAGNELALHGYLHLDDQPMRGPLDQLLRRSYTAGEGEFSRLGREEALRRLQAGIDWFDARGWPLDGFVAPAWLLSRGSWQALRTLPFRYTSTLRYLHALPQGERLTSQSLVYSTRSAWRRHLSIAWNDLLAHTQQSQPLARLELHPHDADDIRVRRAWQTILARQLLEREAMTTAAFVRAWQEPGRRAVISGSA